MVFLWEFQRWNGLLEYILVSETSDEFSGEAPDSVSEKVDTIDVVGSTETSATLEDVYMFTTVEDVGISVC